MEWDLEDFKEFRQALIKCRTEEFKQFQELVHYFVSLPLSEASTIITGLNYELDFKMFSQKMPQVKIDPETITFLT